MEMAGGLCDSSRSVDRGIERLMRRFLILFVVVIAVAYGIVYLPPVRDHVIGLFTVGITQLSGHLIRLFGGEVVGTPPAVVAV